MNSIQKFLAGVMMYLHATFPDNAMPYKKSAIVSGDIPAVSKGLQNMPEQTSNRNRIPQGHYKKLESPTCALDLDNRYQNGGNLYGDVTDKVYELKEIVEKSEELCKNPLKDISIWIYPRNSDELDGSQPLSDAGKYVKIECRGYFINKKLQPTCEGCEYNG